MYPHHGPLVHVMISVKSLILCCMTCDFALLQHGKPRDHKQDVKGKPEGDTSKVARLFGSVLGKTTKAVAESGVIKNEQANAVVKTAGSTVQEQAEMDPTEASASEFHDYCTNEMCTAKGSVKGLHPLLYCHVYAHVLPTVYI